MSNCSDEEGGYGLFGEHEMTPPNQKSAETIASDLYTQLHSCCEDKTPSQKVTLIAEALIAYGDSKIEEAAKLAEYRPGMTVERKTSGKEIARNIRALKETK